MTTVPQRDINLPTKHPVNSHCRSRSRNSSFLLGSDRLRMFCCRSQDTRRKPFLLHLMCLNGVCHLAPPHLFAVLFRFFSSIRTTSNGTRVDCPIKNRLRNEWLSSPCFSCQCIFFRFLCRPPSPAKHPLDVTLMDTAACSSR